MPRPLIGVTLDAEKPGGYSKFPWYALRQNYLDAIDAAGGLAVALPHEPERVADYLERIDALVVTGGAFDVDPSYYGGGPAHATVITKDRRTAFEFGVTRAALAANKPVLGICGGQQLLHVVLGGKLIQHIPESVADALAHEQPNPRNEPGHTVTVAKGTQLHRIVGAD
jgi:putative glutamine amidotransferase